MNLNKVVLDASAAVKLLVDEQESPAVLELYRTCKNCFAPSLIYYEVTNAIYKKCHYSGMTKEFMNALIDNFLLLRKLHIVEVAHELKKAASTALEISHDSVYDLTYLTLALAYDAPLVTYDKKLINRVTNSHYASQITFITP